MKHYNDLPDYQQTYYKEHFLFQLLTDKERARIYNSRGVHDNLHDIFKLINPILPKEWKPNILRPKTF